METSAQIRETAIRLFLASGIIASLSMGCEQQASFSEFSKASEDPTLTSNDPSSPPASCDPFSNQNDPTGSDSQHGLMAKLYIGQPNTNSLSDYFNNNSPLDVNLFFNQLYVPTRSFYGGFLRDGAPIVGQDGETPLLEWFALHFDTRITLSNDDEPGLYQLATLSDDGSRMSMNLDGSGYTSIINDNGVNSTQLNCSQHVVSMQAGKVIPTQIDYFQGPRVRIALILLWRKINTSNPMDPSVAENLCGQNGDTLYFVADDSHPMAPSVPQQAWFDLISNSANHGWKVLNPQNFLLPQGQVNPCASQSAKARALDNDSKIARALRR